VPGKSTDMSMLTVPSPEWYINVPCPVYHVLRPTLCLLVPTSHRPHRSVSDPGRSEVSQNPNTSSEADPRLVRASERIRQKVNGGTEPSQEDTQPMVKSAKSARSVPDEISIILQEAGGLRPKPPFQDLLTSDGERWTGDTYWGASTARSQLVAEPGHRRVTKSCHFCQNQHIWVPCGTEDLSCVNQEEALGRVCQKSFCDRCERC